jgi:hypothetical protein
MPIMFKIFCENNEGNEDFQDKMNDYFHDKENVIIYSMNTVIEKVDNICYMNIIVCWDYKE